MDATRVFFSKMAFATAKVVWYTFAVATASRSAVATSVVHGTTGSETVFRFTFCAIAFSKGRLREHLARRHEEQAQQQYGNAQT
jgi:hypothetical protein